MPQESMVWRSIDRQELIFTMSEPASVAWLYALLTTPGGRDEHFSFIVEDAELKEGWPCWERLPEDPGAEALPRSGVAACPQHSSCWSPPCSQTMEDPGRPHSATVFLRKILKTEITETQCGCLFVT